MAFPFSWRYSFNCMSKCRGMSLHCHCRHLRVTFTVTLTVSLTVTLIVSLHIRPNHKRKDDCALHTHFSIDAKLMANRYIGKYKRFIRGSFKAAGCHGTASVVVVPSKWD